MNWLINILKSYVTQYPSVSVWFQHKIFHFTMCFVAGFLISLSTYNYAAFLFPLLGGILKEKSDMSQGENLSTAILDVIVDSIGALAGIAFKLFIYQQL